MNAHYYRPVDSKTTVPNLIYTGTEIVRVALHQKICGPDSIGRSAHDTGRRVLSINAAKQNTKGEQSMLYWNVRITKILIPVAMVALIFLSVHGLSRADDADVSKAVFFVG